MTRMALIASKGAQDERSALSVLFTWYAPFIVAAVAIFMSARLRLW